jgi:hypothetical protein
MFAGDGLPSHVCEDCVGQVNSFCDFKSMVEASDCSLRDFIRRQQERRCDQVRKAFLPASGCSHIVTLRELHLTTRTVEFYALCTFKVFLLPVFCTFLSDISFKLILLRRIVSSGVLRHVALIRTDVSEELSASFIRVTRIGAQGTTLASQHVSVASYS